MCGLRQPGSSDHVQAPGSPQMVVENLSVSYHLTAGSRCQALQDVSFTLARGETLGIFGPSGSGKTTLAASLLGLLRRESTDCRGAVYFENRNLLKECEGSLRQLRGNRLSLIFQEPSLALHPLLRAEQQVAEVLAAHRQFGRRELRLHAQNTLQRVFSDAACSLAERYPHQLSGGQRQCLLIAQAIACRPSLLIADEPTASLDSGARAEIIQLFRSLRQDWDLSLILISHDASLLESLADRVLVLKEGRIVRIGPASSALQHQGARPHLSAQVEESDSEQATSNTGWPDKKGSTSPQSRSGSAVVLKAENLMKRYLTGPFGSRTESVALRTVSLSLESGKTTALVGPCGSGKSTLALCLTALEQPDSGSLWFEGENIVGLPEKRLRLLRPKLQLVFQDPIRSLNPRLTIEEILKEPFLVHRGRVKGARVPSPSELLEWVGLGSVVLDRRPGQLSGGQKQRIALARALALSPRVLVLDEALSALDRLAQVQIAGRIKAVQRSSGLCCVLITHDASLAREFADEVVAMERGRIVENRQTTVRSTCTNGFLKVAGGAAIHHGIGVS